MSRCRYVINHIQRNDSTESVNLTCQSARTVRLFCSNQFCPLRINTVLAIILLVTSNVAVFHAASAIESPHILNVTATEKYNFLHGVHFCRLTFSLLTYLLMTTCR